MRKYGIVALDEAEYCSPEFVERCGGKVWVVYLYDPETCTHCCEATPSYYLDPIAVEPGVSPEDDDAREKLWDECLDVLAASDPGYYHCRDIDSLPADRKVFREFEEDATLDDARESFQGNVAQPMCIEGAIK